MARPTQTANLWLCLCAASLLGCGAEQHCDPGLIIEGQLMLASGATELNHAPVLVQGYQPELVSAAGAPQPGARPRYALMASGPLSASQSLPYHYSQLGYAQESLFVAWVDVDGHCLAEGKGNPEYDCLPGPGDRISTAPVLGLSQGSSRQPLDFVIGSRLAESGEPRMLFELELGEGAQPWPSSRAALEVTLEAYAAADLADDGPRPGATPLATLGKASLGLGVVLHRFVVPAAARPLRLWAHGVLGGAVFAGANEEGVLFAGQAEQRRAAIGLYIPLRQLP